MAFAFPSFKIDWRDCRLPALAGLWLEGGRAALREWVIQLYPSTAATDAPPTTVSM